MQRCGIPLVISKESEFVSRYIHAVVNLCILLNGKFTSQPVLCGRMEIPKNVWHEQHLKTSLRYSPRRIYSGRYSESIFSDLIYVLSPYIFNERRSREENSSVSIARDPSNYPTAAFSTVTNNPIGSPEIVSMSCRKTVGDNSWGTKIARINIIAKRSINGRIRRSRDGSLRVVFLDSWIDATVSCDSTPLPSPPMLLLHRRVLILLSSKSREPRSADWYLDRSEFRPRTRRLRGFLRWGEKSLNRRSYRRAPLIGETPTADIFRLDSRLRAAIKIRFPRAAIGKDTPRRAASLRPRANILIEYLQ